MINLQISSDQLKNKETLKALQSLLAHLGEQTIETKENKVKKQHDPIPDVEIDKEVMQTYGDYISKVKTLYFLSVIKQNQLISSSDLIEEMTKAYPNFQSRGIGGITGAFSRWSREMNLQIPYAVRKDRHGFNYFTWLLTDH